MTVVSLLSDNEVTTTVVAFVADNEATTVVSFEAEGSSDDNRFALVVEVGVAVVDGFCAVVGDVSFNVDTERSAVDPNKDGGGVEC